MGRRGGNNNVTIREGTGEKNWYPIAGYSAIAVTGAVYIAFSAMQAGTLAASGAVFVVSILLLVGSLPVFWSLFKDAAYVRDTRAGWRPRWWYYIGVPFAATFGVYFIVDALTQDLGGAVALFAFIIVSVTSNLTYLYRRHTRVGVP
jgi:hypothetical protein